MLLTHLSRAVPGHLFCALLVGVVPAVFALHALLDHAHQHLAAEMALGRFGVPSDNLILYYSVVQINNNMLKVCVS